MTVYSKCSFFGSWHFIFNICDSVFRKVKKGTLDYAHFGTLFFFLNVSSLVWRALVTFLSVQESMLSYCFVQVYYKIFLTPICNLAQFSWPAAVFERFYVSFKVLILFIQSVYSFKFLLLFIWLFESFRRSRQVFNLGKRGNALK